MAAEENSAAENGALEGDGRAGRGGARAGRDWRAGKNRQRLKLAIDMG